jgi:hypothetical protein
MTFNIEEINKRLKQTLQKTSTINSVTTPVLKCIVTGKQRVTNNNYLQTKIKKFGTVNEYLANYICSDALKLFKEGKTINEINTYFEIPDEKSISNEKLSYALKYYKINPTTLS